MIRRNRTLLPLIFAVALLPVAGCKKKKAAPPPPPPPPAAAPSPTAELSATPSVVNAGDQVTLKWQTTNANSVSIDNGVGTVPSAGVKTVTPSETTTYHLSANGDGGTADATATVTVNPPPAVSVAPNTMSEQQQFEANVQPIFFDYDTSELRPDAQATLQKDADWLKQHTDVKVTIGGYCDERGSDEYNLALGQRRADATKTALANLGVTADRLSVISYGKEKPFCTESNEQCWQLNRRAGFTMAQ